MPDYIPDPADIELIAEAEGKRRNGPAGDGRGWYRSQADRDECYAVANDVLSALAGRLLPAGGRARTSWAVRDPRGCIRRWPEGEARQVAADCGGTLLSSICTTWPDGTALVGPWLPVANSRSANEERRHERTSRRRV